MRPVGSAELVNGAFGEPVPYLDFRDAPEGARWRVRRA